MVATDLPKHLPFPHVPHGECCKACGQCERAVSYHRAELPHLLMLTAVSARATRDNPSGHEWACFTCGCVFHEV